MKPSLTHFRLSVTHLRIVILTVNLLLAGGMFGFAAYSYYGVSTRDDNVVPLDPSKFVPDPNLVVKKPESWKRIQTAAEAFMPQPRPVGAQEGAPKEADTSKEATTEPEGGPGSLSPGPLADNGWEYAGYILRDDPLRNLVILKKKTENPTRGSTRPSTTSRYRRPITTRRTVGRRLPGVAKDRAAFLVGDRRYKNSDLEMDILIHSADAKEFVYSEYSKPPVRYALKYVTPPGILAEPDSGLRPKEEEESAEGAGDDSSSEKHFISYSRDLDFEKDKESEFRQIIAGGTPGPAFKALSSVDAASSAAPDKSGISSRSRVPPRRVIGPSGAKSGTTSVRGSRGGSSSVSRRPPTAEEQKKLRETFQKAGKKMSPAQRDALRKSMTGGK